MKKHMKPILCILLAIILVCIIIHSAINISNTAKQDKILFSAMPQQKSFSFCSTIGTTDMQNWGIKDIDSVGQKMNDAEISRSYWKIKNTKSVYLYADTSRDEWGLLTLSPSKVPSLSKSNVSRIEIADNMLYNNFYFGNKFIWQDIQTYNLNLDAESKQEFVDMISDYFYGAKKSSETISYDEAKECRPFFIRFYFENFEEIFYCPTEFCVTRYNDNWIILMADKNPGGYAVIDLPERIVDELNQIELLPAKEYNATWRG